MGISNSPDSLHKKMNQMFREFKFIRAYIYELVIITKVDWNNHFRKIETNATKARRQWA